MPYHDLKACWGWEPARDIPPLANEFLKHIMDILITLLLGIAFLPVFLVTALLCASIHPALFCIPGRVWARMAERPHLQVPQSQVDGDHILAEHLRITRVLGANGSRPRNCVTGPRLTRVGK